MKTVTELISELNKEYAEKHPIGNFIDGMFSPRGLFGYRPSYVILRPDKIIQSILLEIKWFFQRGFRGWDDRAVWSVDYWLLDILPQIIWKLRDNVSGVPSRYMPDDWNVSSYRTNIGMTMFRARLFDLAKALEDAREEIDASPNMEKQNKAMKMLADMLGTLWD